MFPLRVKMLHYLAGTCTQNIGAHAGLFSEPLKTFQNAMLAAICWIDNTKPYSFEGTQLRRN